MGLDNKTLAAAKSYVKQSMQGAGALKGQKGDPGKDGKDGENGFSPHIQVLPISGGYHVMVTDVNGSYSFDIMNGHDGRNGVDGINGKDGKDGKDGIDGLNGKDGINGEQGIPGMKGDPGEKGERGDSFAIVKIYADSTEMLSDTEPVNNGFLVAIVDTDNALVYLRDSALIEPGDRDYIGYKYITNLRDATVIRGPRGEKGEQGIQGLQGEPGNNGIDGINGRDGKDGIDGLPGKDGKNGLNGTNGNDGITPHIDPVSKHWFIGDIDTGILAEGTNGIDGVDGKDADPELVKDLVIEKMKYEIRRGYQHILDEDIEYCFASNKTEQVANLDTIYNFTEFSGNKMELSDDGYIILKAGKIYCLEADLTHISRVSNGNPYTYYAIVDVNTGDVISSESYTISPATVGSISCSKIINTFVTPDKDMKVGIKFTILSATSVSLYEMYLSAFEIKQPVVNNIDSDSYSYDEKVVGTWLNGKPLYERVIKIIYGEKSRDSNYSAYRFLEGDLDFVKVKDSVVFGITSNAGSIIDDEGNTINLNGANYTACGNSSSSYTACYAFSGIPGRSIVCIRFQQNLINGGINIAYLKVQYTKTNDTATL